MSTGELKRTALISEFNLEFPNINQYYIGYKSRYCYLSYRESFDNQ